MAIGVYRNIATPRPISRLRARGIKYQWGPTDSRFGDRSSPLDARAINRVNPAVNPRKARINLRSSTWS